MISHNLNRFFDDRNDGLKEKVLTPEKYRKRLDRLVQTIASEYLFAEIIAFQEVESIRVLRDIGERLLTRHGREYHAYLVEGNDRSGIDVGFLIASGIEVKSHQSLFQDTLIGPRNRLFSRPPLLIEVCHGRCISLINLHLRSMRGLRSTKKREKVVLKRKLQAETLARWLQERQSRLPGERLLVLGDFNALTPSDEFVDVVGIIRGDPDQDRPKWRSPDLINRDLIDITQQVSPQRRFSYIYRKKRQQLDYLLISQPLAKSVKSVQFGRINYSLSDHAAIMVDLSPD